MKSGNNKRTLFLLVILGILLVVAYGNYSSDNVVSGADPTTQSQETVDILQKLQAVNLDSSSLSNTVFAYLKDITNPLINLKIGREDPFSLASPKK